MLESNFLIQEVVKRYDGNESSKILALFYYFLLLYGTNLYCVPSLLDHTTMFNFSPFNHALLDLQQIMEASYEIWFVHPVCLDILLSICLSGCFLGSKSLLFSKFWHIVKNPYEDEYNIAGSLEGKHLPQNLGKWTKYETKNVFFFKFIEKFCNYSFQNLFYNESLCCLLYSCTNFIFERNLVPDIWAKILLANQIAGF